jgi:Domain of unknown function (DUF4349)
MNQPLCCLAIAAAASISIASGCAGGMKAENAPSATSMAAASRHATPGEPADGQAAGPAQAAEADAVAAARDRVVVEGALDLEADDPEKVARALRGEVERLGGRVVSERVDGAAASWRALIRLRLPPAQVDAAVAWLERQGEVTSKRIESTDVSRTLFDQEIALGNLKVTLERLRKLLDAGGLSMKDILAVEKEMTRLRGEIERIAGEKRWLEDRVALATIDITVSRREGAAGLTSPRTKVYPGPRLSALTLFDADGRERTRLGAGVAMHIVLPRYSLELDVFDDAPASGDRPAEKHAVLATYGIAMYSDFLGRGERRFLNPYLGLRVGYGYLGYHAVAVQGQAGVELFKHKYMMVDLDVRATALMGDDVDAGLVTGASVVFAF